MHFPELFFLSELKFEVNETVSRQTNFGKRSEPAPDWGGKMPDMSAPPHRCWVGNAARFYLCCISSAIDSCCKLDRPKLTKRNPVNNPWICDSIVDAIDKKDQLYEDWISSKKLPEFKPVGDFKLHKIFSDYRRCLKKIIKHQKDQYYCNKILENAENSKKMWEVINEVRGKKKKNHKTPICCRWSQDC